jgi:hypothetical protein
VPVDDGDGVDVADEVGDGEGVELGETDVAGGVEVGEVEGVAVGETEELGLGLELGLLVGEVVGVG